MQWPTMWKTDITHEEEPNTIEQKLRRAGDVETNPGPQWSDEDNEKQICKKCTVTIRRGSDFMTCKACKGTFHKQMNCSGETKHRIENMTNSRKVNWICTDCRRALNHARPTITTEAVEDTINKPEARKCRTCKGIVRQGYDFLECSECKKPVHKKKDCSDESTDAIKKLDRTTWRCRGCIQAEAERETRRSYVEDRAEVEYVMKKDLSKEESIKILQWNADTISTKKEELKMLLKEREVDVFLIQETKMTKEDKLPIFPGYTLVSKPRQQVSGNEKNRGGCLLTGVRSTIPFREIKKNNL